MLRIIQQALGQYRQRIRLKILGTRRAALPPNSEARPRLLDLGPWERGDKGGPALLVDPAPLHEGKGGVLLHLLPPVSSVALIAQPVLRLEKPRAAALERQRPPSARQPLRIDDLGLQPLTEHAGSEGEGGRRAEGAAPLGAAGRGPGAAGRAAQGLGARLGPSGGQNCRLVAAGLGGQEEVRGTE